MHKVDIEKLPEKWKEDFIKTYAPLLGEERAIEYWGEHADHIRNFINSQLENGGAVLTRSEDHSIGGINTKIVIKFS